MAAIASSSETEGRSLAFVGAAWIMADCSVYLKAFSDKVAPLKNDCKSAEDVWSVDNFNRHIVISENLVKLFVWRLFRIMLGFVLLSDATSALFILSIALKITGFGNCVLVSHTDLTFFQTYFMIL